MTSLPTRSRQPAARRPGRRTAAGASVAPVLFLGMSAASGGLDPAGAPGWTALVALVATVGATVLATYVPAAGSWPRLTIGCTPCATVASLTIPASAAVLSSGPGEVPSAVLALLVASFGLAQRLRDPGTCSRPTSA